MGRETEGRWAVALLPNENRFRLAIPKTRHELELNIARTLAAGFGICGIKGCNQHDIRGLCSGDGSPGSVSLTDGVRPKIEPSGANRKKNDCLGIIKE